MFAERPVQIDVSEDIALSMAHPLVLVQPAPPATAGCETDQFKCGGNLTQALGIAGFSESVKEMTVGPLPPFNAICHHDYFTAIGMGIACSSRPLDSTCTAALAPAWICAALTRRLFTNGAGICFRPASLTDD